MTIERSNTHFKPWSTLEKMLTLKRLEIIDILLAEHLLQGKTSENEAAAALICHISKAAGQGHLCVSIPPEGLNPSVEDLWIAKGENENADDRAWISEINSLILQGIHSLDSSLITSNISQRPTTPLYREGNNYYFQRNWVLQCHFIKHYQERLKDKSPYLTIEISKVENLVEKMQCKAALLQEQADAIIQSAKECLTLIIGGPGTGKTYTAGQLLCTLLECFDESVKKELKVVAAAPTGKAASHLHASLSSALNSDLPKIQAQTLHALLGVKENRSIDRPLYCDADILIVDECSMIDVWMMGDLMGAIKPGSRLIMLGDPNQLPSVESGSLFSDLVEYHLNLKTASKNVIKLTKCQRTDLKEMLTLAMEISQGNAETVFSLLTPAKQGNSLSATFFDGTKPLSQIQSEIVKKACHYYMDIGNSDKTPLEMMNDFSKFKVLSFLREGFLGVDALNQKIFDACCNPASKKGHFAVPIMITKNDYRMNLFNGDMGILIQPGLKEMSDSYVYFPDRNQPEGFRKINETYLPPYEYAYCLSVHKSQGSEFDNVLLVVLQGAEVFGKEALYTAVTRAKSALEIVTPEKILTAMINKSTKRRSGVVEALNKLQLELQPC